MELDFYYLRYKILITALVFLVLYILVKSIKDTGVIKYLAEKFKPKGIPTKNVEGDKNVEKDIPKEMELTKKCLPRWIKRQSSHFCV